METVKSPVQEMRSRQTKACGKSRLNYTCFNYKQLIIRGAKCFGES
jgi:hypothetical protein